ncbi:MAG: fumarylacetoacetate hydrolase family protein [Myxococcota bacterium]
MKIQIHNGDAVETADIKPTKILCLGRNYRAHAEELGNAIPKEPLMFFKPPSALVESGGAIVRPRGYDRVDFEGELAVVIATRARRVSADRALDYVLGYTCLNDVTVRDLQKRDKQWSRAKGFDTFCPVGPRIVTGLDPGDLRLITRVNGEVRQDGRTSSMILSTAEYIAFASRYMTLEPGDILATGTPAGVGNLAIGDVVSVEIEGIGVLENRVIDDVVDNMDSMAGMGGSAAAPSDAR